MTICETCTGTGLVGQGPTPHLRQGRTEVCKACGGSGKTPEKAVEAPAQATNPDGNAEPTQGDAPVDNSEDKPAPKRGILSRIFSR